MPMPRRFIPFCVLSVLLALGSTAQESTPEGLLAGPPVDLDTLPGVERTFGGEQAMVPQMGARPVPMRVFGQAIRGLVKHKDKAVRPSPEQAREFRAMFDTFRREIEQARRAKRAQADNQDRRPSSIRDLPDDPQERAKVIKGMLGNQPHPADIQQAIWAKLSDAQREVLRAAIDEYERQQTDKAGQRRLEQMKQSIAQNLASSQRRDPFADAFNEDGSVNLEALPERLRVRLEPLGESRRRQIVERLIERRRQAQHRRPEGEDRPSPSIDAVDVPA